MKKLYVVNLCVLLIMFLTAGIVGRPNTDNQQVKELISGRITVLNDFYSQTRSFDHTEKSLKKIEKGVLLRNDLVLMEAYSATDLDRIKSAKVRIKSCRRSSFGIIKGKAEVSYVMEGQRGKWQDKQLYYFTAEDQNKRMKLTQLKKL